MILIDVCSIALQQEVEQIEHKCGNVYEAKVVPSKHRQHRMNQMMAQQQWSSQRDSSNRAQNAPANPGASASPQRGDLNRDVGGGGGHGNVSVSGLGGVHIGNIGVAVVPPGATGSVSGQPVNFSVSDGNELDDIEEEDEDIPMARGVTSDHDDDMGNME